MKPSLLLITHSGVGPALLSAVRGVFGPLPLKTAAVEAGFHEDAEQVFIRASAVIREFDPDAGILILTDLYGSTPSNVAARLVNLGCTARRVAGLNLPMLLRIMNYSEQTLDELVAIATTGARNGVVIDHAS